MRVGFNPHKDQPQQESDCFHQVVVPVYIPNEEGYFKDSFEIFKLCLDSLFKTIHKKTYITIVNNGSCDVVIDYLNKLFLDGEIQEIINTSNIGKLNAIVKGIVGHDFSLVTVTDADVLFLKDWQKATYAVFEAFPRTGVVCPTPSSRSLRTYTANIYWDLFFSKRLHFSRVENRDALKMFANSVGNAAFYNEIQLQKYLTVSRNETKAVAGAGHFIATYRGEVFDNLESRFSKYKLGGDSEGKFLDLPVVKKGFWRLSTVDNYTYHMGNSIEEWMYDEVLKLEKQVHILDFKIVPYHPNGKWVYYLKTKLFGKFILNKKMMPYFLIWKGLSKEESKNYLK
jgi:hypothetical protein